MPMAHPPRRSAAALRRRVIVPEAGRVRAAGGLLHCAEELAGPGHACRVPRVLEPPHRPLVPIGGLCELPLRDRGLALALQPRAFGLFVTMRELRLGPRGLAS